MRIIDTPPSSALSVVVVLEEVEVAKVLVPPILISIYRVVGLVA